MTKSFKEKCTFNVDGRIYRIPDYMQPGLIEYINYHIRQGSFLTKVLENNLVGACLAADDNNIANLPAYANFLYNYAPIDCWGSPLKVQAWIHRIDRKDRLNDES